MATEEALGWVPEFFHRYAEAFHGASRGELLTMMHVPLVFLTKSGPLVLAHSERVQANLEALLQRYCDLGAVDWRFEVKGACCIGQGIAEVDLAWSFVDAGGALLFACDTTYFLSGKSASTAKVMAIIAHNENEEYEKALTQRSTMRKPTA